MITVKQLLASCRLETEPEQIKLVRHSDHLGRSIRRIIDEGHFDAYQAEQSPTIRPFHRCEVIASFVAIEGNQALFHGVYRVLGFRDFRKSDFAGVPPYLKAALADGNRRIWYDLKELPELAPLRGRLVVQWKSTRGWFQTKDLEVFQILPPGNQVAFPGYQNVVLSWRELKDIIATPVLHRDWKVALSATAAIYRIVDTSTGKIYIGSASGADGIWKRWSDYARTGHGGNKLLRPLDPNHFRWSIIRTLSGSMSEREVIHIERIEMEKHGSRAIGLNS